MKKILGSKIVYFVLGAIIFSSITAYAFTLTASDVSYNDTTVKGALGDLYDASSNGQMQTVLLGTGTSFDIKNHEVLGKYYQDLTTDNFYYRLNNGSNTSSDANYDEGAIKASVSFTTGTLSYDPSTGILTFTQPKAAGNAYYDNRVVKTATVNINYNIYCNYVE